MEEIKLPKFKTKEELEQFAMGLMTENESLKTLIKCKDDSIKQLRKSVLDGLHTDIVVSTQKDIIKNLESEVQSLGEKYKKAFEEKWDYKRKFDKAEKMVHKLCSMVTFMFGLLPLFKAKRVKDVFGEFNIADYRL